MTEIKGPKRLPLASVALISAAVLATEILLTRIFSIVHWHHFAYMIVSLALLGFGASGTFLTLAQRPLTRQLSRSYCASMTAFGVTALACPLLAQRLPLQVEALLWDPWQPFWLLLVYVVLAIPFFCGATAIGLALTVFQQSSGRVYAADLAGAGLGSVAVLAGLGFLSPETLLRAIAVIAAAAVVIGALELGASARRWGGVALLVSVTAWLVPYEWLRVEPGPYKGLSQALNVVGSRIVLERSSPLGRIDVVANTTVPWRHAPGLSLAAIGEPPPQLAVFTDGGAMEAVTSAVPDLANAPFLTHATGALAYRIGTPGSVLVLDAGGGLEILRAQSFGARQIDALELNHQLVGLLHDDLAEFTGNLVASPAVNLAVGEARGWLEGGARRYDAIVMTSAGGSPEAGLGGVNEDYTLTVEALRLYLEHLTRGGMLSITGDVQVPPRASLKTVAAIRAALESAGIADASDRLAMIRGWQTWTLVVKNGPLNAAEIAGVREFADAMSFDLVWHPGLEPRAVNRYNQLREPYFYDGVRTLLGPGRDRFITDYAFDVTPATDDRPYFQDFFRWDLLDDVLDARERGGMALLEAGYLLVVVVALQALVAGTVLILLPLAVRARVRHVSPRVRWRVFAYFGAIGIGFLFLEIAYLQKSLLLLHHPTVAFAVTLATFLVGAGAGSACSARVPPERLRAAITVAAVSIVALAIASVHILDLVGKQIAAWPLTGKSIAVSLTMLPLAFCLGVPFPAALRQVEPVLVPWAWGINGCASVVSAALAALLAVDFGFGALVAVAALGYALVPWTLPVPRAR
ncbi:MAG TPA: hypothetical protein VLT59_05130 [Steroidobacteraceae bacterium]|nr:hypothetical protein [Steroidobacteraceae bacterium]